MTKSHDFGLCSDSKNESGETDGRLWFRPDLCGDFPILVLRLLFFRTQQPGLAPTAVLHAEKLSRYAYRRNFVPTSLLISKVGSYDSQSQLWHTCESKLYDFTFVEQQSIARVYEHATRENISCRSLRCAFRPFTYYYRYDWEVQSRS